MARNELFIIAPETLAAADEDNVRATVEDLRTLGLYRLPFPKVDLQFAVEVPREFTMSAGTDMSIVDAVIAGDSHVLHAAKTKSSIACRFIGVDIEGTGQARARAARRERSLIMRTQTASITNTRGIPNFILFWLYRQDREPECIQYADGTWVRRVSFKTKTSIGHSWDVATPLWFWEDYITIM